MTLTEFLKAISCKILSWSLVFDELRLGAYCEVSIIGKMFICKEFSNSKEKIFVCHSFGEAV